MSDASLPLLRDLPARWTRSDAARVLAALDASGLTDAEFHRRTGIQPQRVRRWRRQGEEPLRRDEPGVRLVELVPRESAPPPRRIGVTSPGGWRLEVPEDRLGDLVRALSC